MHPVDWPGPVEGPPPRGGSFPVTPSPHPRGLAGELSACRLGPRCLLARQPTPACAADHRQRVSGAPTQHRLAANTPNGSGHLEPKAESLLSGKWIARHVFGDEGCFPDLGCVQGRLHIGMDQQHHRHWVAGAFLRMCCGPKAYTSPSRWPMLKKPVFNCSRTRSVMFFTVTT
jgi:hypothetical protein